MGLQLPGIPKNSERTSQANLFSALAVGGDKRNYCSGTSFFCSASMEEKKSSETAIRSCTRA